MRTKQKGTESSRELSVPIIFVLWLNTVWQQLTPKSKVVIGKARINSLVDKMALHMI